MNEKPKTKIRVRSIFHHGQRQEGYEYKQRKDYYGTKEDYGDKLLKIVRKAILNCNPYLLKFFMDNGIAVVPGSAFGDGFDGYIRLSFSTVNEELSLAGARRLTGIVNTKLKWIIDDKLFM